MGIAKALAAKNGYELDSNQEVCDFLLSPSRTATPLFSIDKSDLSIVCCEIEQIYCLMCMS